MRVPNVPLWSHNLTSAFVGTLSVNEISLLCDINIHIYIVLLQYHNLQNKERLRIIELKVEENLHLVSFACVRPVIHSTLIP